MNLRDFALQLAIQEEAQKKNNSHLQQSIDSLNETMKQQVNAPSKTSATVGKSKYFTKTFKKATSHGNIFQVEKNVTFWVFKFKTPTEWKNLVFNINGENFLEGDFEYYNEIGLAYYDPETSEYVFNLEDENFKDGVKVATENGLYINLFTVAGRLEK